MPSHDAAPCESVRALVAQVARVLHGAVAGRSRAVEGEDDGEDGRRQPQRHRRQQRPPDVAAHGADGTDGPAAVQVPAWGAPARGGGRLRARQRRRLTAAAAVRLPTILQIFWLCGGRVGQCGVALMLRLRAAPRSRHRCCTSASVAAPPPGPVAAGGRATKHLSHLRCRHSDDGWILWPS